MASAAKVFGAWFKVVVGCYSLESNREYGCLLTGPSISPQKGPLISSERLLIMSGDRKRPAAQGQAPF